MDLLPRVVPEGRMGIDLFKRCVFEKRSRDLSFRFIGRSYTYDCIPFFPFIRRAEKSTVEVPIPSAGYAMHVSDNVFTV